MLETQILETINLGTQIKKKKKKKRYEADTVFALNEDELKTFFETVQNSKRKHKNRNFLIFKMIFFHGLRRCECVAIRMKDVDFEENTIYIEGRKGGRRGDEVLNPIEKDLILEYLKSLDFEKTKNDYLFHSQKGQKISEKTIAADYAKYAKMAKLERAKRHIHCLRHSLAVFMADKGFAQEETQALLRHTDIKTTQKYYKIGKERKFKIQNRVFESLG